MQDTSCHPVSNFSVPCEICSIVDLPSTGVRMHVTDGRLQFLTFLSIAANEMELLQIAYLACRWDAFRHYAHNVKSSMLYMQGPGVVAALNCVCAVLRASSDDFTQRGMPHDNLVFRLLPHVDAATRAFKTYEAWMTAYVWKLECNAKIAARGSVQPSCPVVAPKQFFRGRDPDPAHHSSFPNDRRAARVRSSVCQ